jgi:hypothetical protein
MARRRRKVLGQAMRGVAYWPILLQKSVAGFLVSDSVAVTRFATGAGPRWGG